MKNNLNINTGMIMDAVNLTKDAPEKNEAMQAAIDNDQIKKLEILAQQYKKAHTQKVREYKKIGRNDPCPCGSLDKNGKHIKFKNCCMNKKNWNSYINI